MSKHLRFGKLLGMLAVMLTLSFAWGQAQNLSSQKQLLTFGFTTAANPSAQLGSDVWGTINQTTKTVSVTVPFQAVVTSLKASFTASEFSNVFVGVNPSIGILATSGGNPAVDYTLPVTWTVEAENFSYENYVVTVGKAAPSTAKDLLTFTANYTKTWGTSCTPSSQTGAANISWTGNSIFVDVPFGTNLAAVPVTFTSSPYSTVWNGATQLTSPTTLNLTAPVTLTVVSQAGGAGQNYTVTAAVGVVSTLDNLISFNLSSATSVTINHTNQTIAAIVPYSAVIANLVPSWTISPYARMFDNNGGTEICSGVTALGTMASYLAGPPATAHFWIVAEDPSEVSEYILTVTKAAPSTANTLTAISARSTQGDNCYGEGSIYNWIRTNVGSISGGVITFSVPFGVTSVSVTSISYSALATSTTVSGTSLVDGSIVAIVAESGAVNNYTVDLVQEPASNSKVITHFGFHKDINNGYPFPDWSTDMVGVVDQTLKRITVTVPFDTDLHDLKAYFYTGYVSCVYIAESNGNYTLQVPDMTENDHSNALTYVVTAQDGTEERYEVMVVKAAAQTGNDITAFSITGLANCTVLGGSFDVAGTITGTNISVVVPNKSSINLASLAYSLTVSAGATVTPGLTGTMSSPATFTVTSQSGVSKTYTVTVTKTNVTANPASRKQLTKYWFDGAPVNSLAVVKATGSINEAAKTVEVWVPWGTNVTNLKAGFELNDGLGNYAGGVVMTHSEDPQVVQVSNTTPNDFTTPVAYTVIAEDCSTVEYFVTVKVTPESNVGISAFTFNVTGCGCGLVNKIDTYARRIYITLPYTMDISNLAPASIVVFPSVGGYPAATVSPAAGVAQDWTKGPVKYTVTAPDGVTKADWMVYVTNPPCKDASITAFSLPYAQVQSSDILPGHGSPVVIDAINHKIDVIVKKGTNLSRIYYERTLSCGATICCVGGNCQDNNYLDFSEGGCHTCIVTAQDETVKVEWTICVHEIDSADPKVMTWSVMAYNCSDSVAVQSNEAGRVFLVNEEILNKTVSPWVVSGYNLWDWTNSSSVATSVARLVADRKGAWAAVAANQVDVPVYVKTEGLYSGYYWAFAVDNAGRISCISDQRVYLDICEKEIATVCDLRNQPDVWKYKLTAEVLVSYEENREGGNWKFVQDATCGILIEDRLGALPATKYGEGTGLKNLIGTLDKSGAAVKFIPVCCYTPEKSSTGNVVPVKELTFDQYLSQCYTGNAFESMLVKVTTPMMAANDYGQGPNWVYDGLDLHTWTLTTGIGSYYYIIQSVFNTPLIGTAIPVVPSYFTGVRTNVFWGASKMGMITPRKAADIVPVTGVLPVYKPNPAVIDDVMVGQCKSIDITIYNEGAASMNITAIYLDDSPATDEFNLVTPPQVPFTIGSWSSRNVTVQFCPLNAGDESTNLIVEYGVGKTLVIPINGKTVSIFQIPYTTTFNTDASLVGWSSFNMIYGSVGYNLIVDEAGRRGFYYGWSWVTPTSANPIILNSPGFDLRTAKKPTVTYWLGTYFSSQLRVEVSEDKVNWTVIKNYGTFTFGNGVGKFETLDLSAFAGKIIFIRWYSPFANYYGLDQITVQEVVTDPILKATPDNVNLGGVQLGSSASATVSITNIGASLLKIKKVELVGGPEFALTDTNGYPFEVITSSGNYAYTVGNAGSKLDFTVGFTPTDIGVKTAKVVITYGMYSDMTFEIPVTAEGLSCYTASDAVIGRNWAPSQNTWWKYTADKFQIVTVTSCDEHQDAGYNAVYAWDTWLYVYADCEGTLLGQQDDMEAACQYNRASSTVTTVVNAGQTIYIFWPLAFPTAEHAYEGFYFNISVTYPLEGDVCENAIPLTLPVVNHFGTTVGFNDDYDASPCSPFSNYMDGNDKVYTITLPYEGYLTGNILGAYGSIHVLDVCPTEELEKFHCKAFVGGPNGGQFEKKIAEGTYFVIISTWAPPQTVDFLLNMSFRGTGVDDSALMTNLSVYPNPTNGKFTVNISNAEAADMTLELVNISGQVVYRNEVKSAFSYTEDIDASSFAKGVYYLKVNNGQEVKIEKVVLQ